MTRSVGRIGVRYAKDIHGGVCMKLYFNDQSQVNQCTLVNKHICFTNGHCGRHQKANLCLFRMSPFMADIINELKLLIRNRHLL